MLNVLPFVAGLIAGAAAVTALRGERPRALVQDTGARLRAVYDEAQSGVRTAARTGFDLLRGVKPAQPVEAAAEASASPSAEPTRKPVARKSAKKTASAKPAAAKSAAIKPSAAKPKAPRAPRKAEPEQAGA